MRARSRPRPSSASVPVAPAAASSRRSRGSGCASRRPAFGIGLAAASSTARVSGDRARPLDPAPGTARRRATPARAAPAAIWKPVAIASGRSFRTQRVGPLELGHDAHRERRHARQDRLGAEGRHRVEDALEGERAEAFVDDGAREVDDHDAHAARVAVASDQLERAERLVRAREGHHHDRSPHVDRRRAALEALGPRGCGQRRQPLRHELAERREGQGGRERAPRARGASRQTAASRTSKRHACAPAAAQRVSSARTSSPSTPESQPEV